MNHLVLRVTSAYERGFDPSNRGEFGNPYTIGSIEHEAWDRGREIGKRKFETAQADREGLVKRLMRSIDHFGAQRHVGSDGRQLRKIIEAHARRMVGL